MKQYISFLLILFLTGSNLIVFGQRLTSFSGDPAKYIGEMSQLFQFVNDINRKDCEKKLKEFADLWNTGVFDPDQQARILALSDQMLKKRVRSYPDFYHFLMALINLQGSQQSDANFINWFKGMETLLAEKNQRRFLSFLEMSITLFGDNLLYKSGSTIWKARNRTFTIGIDTIPYLVFQNTDLTCFSSRDSLNIYGTSGVYFPTLERWKGRGGKVTWVKAGLDAGTVHAMLSKYEIYLRFSQYKADSVQLINQLYFKAPLEGKLEDKSMTISSPEKATFPRFTSYEKTISFPNIFKNINYEGGFEMEGAQVIGSGEKKGDAKLTILKDNKMLMRVNAKHFIIRKDRIDASKAAVVIYLIHDSVEYIVDSVYHPGLQMKYLDEKKEISLSGEESFSAKTSPFFDSYHKIDIYCEGIVWDITKPLIDFRAISATNREGRAVIESANYYAERRYDNLQGMDEQNPLYLLKNMSLHAKSRDFTLDEVRNRLQKPPEQVEAMLIRLSNQGYLIYDSDDKRVILKDKLFDYIDAKNKKKDYDMISFSSVITGKSNATLNMANNDLLLRGVPEINVSDSQRVAIFPANQELILRGNRDMVFNGKIEAGLFDFYTKDCSFDYAGFKFNMPTVDSMAIFVFSRKRNDKGEYPLVKVKSVVEDLSGVLLIDHPSNKSGLKSMKDYPEFTSEQSSSVFYDAKKVQDGAYKRDQFYYEVYPFNMKGIDRLPTDSIRFKGRLVSAGIFPDIEKSLIIQDDYSLGFNLRTTKDGLPIYDGKGTFVSDVSLSNKGLKGDGTYHYLAATSESKDITFLPELLKSTNTRFALQEHQLVDIAYPTAKGDSLEGRWYTKSDSLTMTTSGKMLEMYRDQSLFDGTLALTPTGLTGEGMIRIGDADMDSKSFKFGKRIFDANIANFRIKSYDLKELSISTRNYQTHFDFDERKGAFKSNVGISRVDFPINQYSCSMDQFDWSIDKNEIILRNEISQSLMRADTMSTDNLIDFKFPRSAFISTRADQDSLTFFAREASFNLKSSIIRGKDVQIIKVADAAIFPDSGKVTVMKSGLIEKLTRAGIIANTTTRYHRFYRGDITIQSRKSYSGKAMYDYLDEDGKRQQIAFSRVGIDSAGSTYAIGSVADTSFFMLSPDFRYSGKVDLAARDKFLTFTGDMQLVEECRRGSKPWIQFKSQIDPKKLEIPVTRDIRDRNNGKLMTGILFSNATNRIVPAFLQRRESTTDTVMIQAFGMLDFNKLTRQYAVSKRMADGFFDPSQDVVWFDKYRCITHGEGKINLSINTGPMNLDNFGWIDCFMIPDTVNLRISMVFDFKFQEECLKKMTTAFEGTNLPGVSISKVPYALSMKRILGVNEAEKLLSEIESLGKFRKYPDELAKTLFFADVKLFWDSVSSSYISRGPIGLGSILKSHVNKYVSGLIQLSKRRNGDEINIYLEIDKDQWYYFNYRINLMQVISSDIEFNDLIKNDMKERAEKGKIDKDDKGYRFILATDRKKEEFLRRFREVEE